MRITRFVTYAGFFMAWSREAAQSKTAANEMSGVDLELDINIGITLDMSPNSSIIFEPYTKAEALRKNDMDPVTVTSLIANNSQQALENLNTSIKKKKKKKKRGHKEKIKNKQKTEQTASKYLNDDNHTRYIYFPGDGDYKIHKIDIMLPIAMVTIANKKVSYWLYTRQNPTSGQSLKMDDVKGVSESKLDVRKDTVFLSHGYQGSRDTPANVLLTEAFLNNSDVNVIRMDWSHYASSLWYPTSSGYAPKIGKKLGKFIHWLNRSFGLSLDKVHLVGFSLGAHLVGNAGRELEGKAKRLTGLDPAGPGWWGDPASLDKTDARYVEVIHTNGGYLSLGYWDPLGHSDHYPNGGHIQPNCSRLPFSRNICSHYRAYELMAATVKLNHLPAKKCASARHAMLNTCNNGGKLQPMGTADINKSQSGIFRVSTKGAYPYSKKEKHKYH